MKQYTKTDYKCAVAQLNSQTGKKSHFERRIYSDLNGIYYIKIYGAFYPVKDIEQIHGNETKIYYDPRKV